MSVPLFLVLVAVLWLCIAHAVPFVAVVRRILIMNKVYMKLAYILTNFENHPTDTECAVPCFATLFLSAVC